jgi:hypothetical protein
MKWGSFPRWVGEKLTEFTAGQNAGAHMAALRVYLALALVADFSSRTASISWTALQQLTGLSRPMVMKGIATATGAGLIEVDTSHRMHSYRLLGRDNEASFTKVPLSLSSTLSQLPARGFHALDALKVYMTLLTVRGRDSQSAVISHKKIAAWSGVQARRVRAAIDVLINHHLVHVTSVESATTGHPHNEYHLLGFSNARAVPSSSSTADAPFAVPVIPRPSFLQPGAASDPPKESPF